MNGSEVIRFEPSGDLWVSRGHTQESVPARAECAQGTDDGCNMPYRVFMDSAGLVPVSSIADVTSGSYYFDTEADDVYIADDPRGALVELSTAALGMTGTRSGVAIDDVEVRNLVWEKFANQASTGVISTFAGRDWLIADNEVRSSHGCGIWSGSGAIVRNNDVHHMGQLGLCGQGEDILVEGNVVSYNNTDGFKARWEGGGSKWVNTTNLTVRNNHVHHNNGPGLWTDGNNIFTLYENNVVDHNTDEGIFHEISYEAMIRNNTVLNNGRNLGAWGAGIVISSSRDVTVTGNEVSGPWSGISLLEENRGEGNHGRYLLKNVSVTDNTVTIAKGATGVSDLTFDGGAFRKARNLVFDSNSYSLPTATTRAFVWSGKRLAPKSWRGIGMDLAGVFLTNVI
jgi:parallel beta-helix repeat protein